MALSRSITRDIPKDAVIISEDEALHYQWKIISQWDKKEDVWSLRYTPGIIGMFSAATGIFVNNHYRNKLKLGNYGRLSSYLPIVVIPAMFSVLSHKFFVQRSIILDPFAECPLCLQVRAAAFQSAVGVIYPTILAPFAAFMFATRHYTYRLPSVTENPMEVFQLWRKMTRPIMPILGTIIAAQSLVTMYLTYKQSEQAFRLQLKMKQIEQRFDEEQVATTHNNNNILQ